MEHHKNVHDGGFMTLGDLCQAIADRELPATLEDGFYVVSRRDINRYGRTGEDLYGPLVVAEIAERVEEPIAS